MFYPSYILLSSLVVINACGAAIQPSTDIISIRNVNRRILNYIGQEKDRFKRSSPNFFTIVKDKVKSGIKSKLSDIASSSKHFSGGSSGGHHPEPAFHHEHEYEDPHAFEHYHPHPEYHSEEPFEVKSFDFWDLQKSILHTLLQAAKAIKGGLIAVKGHLIKGSGYVISAKGKLLAAKGEAISNLGKHIASTAVLSPYPHHIEHHPGYETEYSHGPQFESYSPHHADQHHENYHHEQPHHYEAHMKSPSKGIHGILVLQKIPKTHSDHLSLHGNHDIPSLPDSFVPDYIQSDPKANLKSVIRNYLLSSSHHKLNPNPVETFEDDKFSDHYISLQSHEEFQPHDSKIFQPTPNSVDYQDFKHESHIEYKFNDNTSIPSDNFQSNKNPNLKPLHETSNLKPPSTNYGVPFELKENFNSPNDRPQINMMPVSALETYEPLFFPDNTAHYMLQRPDNFAKHPVESSNLENDYNANKNSHPSYSQANHLLNHFNKFGNLPELEVSSSEHKQSVYPKRVEQRYKNKHLTNKNVSNKSRRTRPNVTKRKLPSHNKIYRPSWTQRPLTKL